MQVLTSYKVKIIGYNSIFENTLKIYREALSYLMNAVNAEWDSVKDITHANERMNHIERLVHGTKNRVVTYEFDERYYKFPSYLRRSAINEAIGKVSSYRSNLEKWTNNGRKGKAPSIQTKHYSYPALFRDNMYMRVDDYTASVKIYHQNDWVWLRVKLRKSDADYIKRHKSQSEESVPTLTKSGKNWYLRFAFIDKVELAKEQNVITAVDIGINNAATCSAMLPDGTIIGRKIISYPVEQDRMETKLNRIKKAQQGGARRTPRLWAYANNYNRTLSEKTAKAIVEFASQYCSDIIVFERLDMQGKKRGPKKQKLHIWRKRAVYAMATTKAHLLGMRVSTVCAWNTSKLAFDGSGPVERDEHNYSMCTFATGKRYHCDLSASYNIGARYYIRGILKSLPVTVRLATEAKVPRLAKRTTCTLSDLISLSAELARLAAEVI